ncbi:MAG: DUF268 domain-containing protein [Bryobacteraceae bacterium]
MSSLLSLSRLFGFDPVRMVRSLYGLAPFFSDYRRFSAQSRGRRAEFPGFRFYPCLTDRYEEAGEASGAYFNQDLLVARRIFEANPRRHIDIGSRIDGFVAHVAVFRKIEVIDVRPLRQMPGNISFLQADLIEPLRPDLISCCDSLSSLHALEHFGLGRYGDRIDFDGHRKAVRNMTAMVEPGGTFYLSVPIGSQRIEFNAHRVFEPGYIVDLVAPDMELSRFAYVDDAGALHEVGSLDRAKGAYGCHWGVGIFEFRNLPGPASAAGSEGTTP